MDNLFIKKLKLLKERKNQKIFVEILIFISLALRSYYLFVVALLSWLVYLFIGMRYYIKENKIVFFVYLCISIIVIYLLYVSVAGLMKLWALQGIFPNI